MLNLRKKVRLQSYKQGVQDPIQGDNVADKSKFGILVELWKIIVLYFYESKEGEEKLDKKINFMIIFSNFQSDIIMLTQ